MGLEIIRTSLLDTCIHVRMYRNDLPSGGAESALFDSPASEVVLFVSSFEGMLEWLCYPIRQMIIGQHFIALRMSDP